MNIKQRKTQDIIILLKIATVTQ